MRNVASISAYGTGLKLTTTAQDLREQDRACQDRGKVILVLTKSLGYNSSYSSLQVINPIEAVQLFKLPVADVSVKDLRPFNTK